MRTLRNRLEEADEALSGTSFAPEDIRVLEAAGESKNVLNKLEAVLQRDEGKTAEDSETEDTAADLVAHFSIVVKKLSKALQDQDLASGQADMLLAETRRKHDSHLSASTASAEHTRGMSRETSTRSSTTSHSSYDPEKSPEPAKLPAIAEQNVPGRARAVRSPGSPRSAGSQNSPTMYNYPDPSKPLLRSSSKAAVPDFTTAGDSRFDAGTARGAHPQMTRAFSDPYQVNYYQGWPPQAAIPMVPGQFVRPHYAGLQQPPLPASLPNSLSATPSPPPSTMLPMRPRYYVANPDPGMYHPAELPGDIGKGMPHPTWHTGSPEMASMLPEFPYPPQQQHPALRYHYETAQYNDGSRPATARSPEQVQTHHNKSDSASTLRHALSRTESNSSEALPSDMRMASPTLPGGSTGPAVVEKSPFNPAQVDKVMEQWNERDWTRAEATLQDLHRQAISFNQPDLARRLRHTLGVIASVQGRWQQALSSFLSVFRTTISDDGILDDGDCAAAYWLGDTYCLLNRPAEALVAYLIAEHGSLFRGTHLRQRVLAEQKGCICIPTGSNSTNDWKTSWEREEKRVDRNAGDSIFHPQTLAKTVEQKLLDRARIRAEARKDSNQHVLDQNHSRVMAFRVLGADAGSYELDYRLKIGQSAFENSGPWPLMFDPFFAMANVVRGRLVANPCDLLSLIRFDTSLRMPKAGSRNKKSSFVHQDLQWLIVTVRECLTAMKMTITEVANPTECCFIARWSASSCFHEREKARGHVATFNFLTITFSRAGFGKSGYVLDVAGEGLYSARIIRGDWMYDKGVATSETERIRSMILDHLNAAAKQPNGSSFTTRELLDKTSKKKGARSFLSVTSGDSRAASITSRG